MAQYRILKNAATGTILLKRLKWGDNYWIKFAGLMLRRNLPEDEGLVFAYGRESRLETSIHMFFMAFAIATVWLDKDGLVVDKVLAKPWRPAYASRVPAQYVIEARPSLLEKVAVGDRLVFG
ncbi:MAG TPA: DUF192 domain-containing protein [Aggregatilineaceae bacterium]|nr:DUF192 domain-containing protein [Aggregatilineaceae bacterium]